MTAVPIAHAPHLVTVAGVRAALRDAARLAFDCGQQTSISELLELACDVPVWGGHQCEAHFVALLVCCKTVADWYGDATDIRTPLPHLVVSRLLRDAATRVTPVDLAPWCDGGTF